MTEGLKAKRLPDKIVPAKKTPAPKAKPASSPKAAKPKAASKAAPKAKPAASKAASKPAAAKPTKPAATKAPAKAAPAKSTPAKSAPKKTASKPVEKAVAPTATQSIKISDLVQAPAESTLPHHPPPAGRPSLCLIEIVKDGHFFIARTDTASGAKEYKNTVFEDLLTEMLITLQEQLVDA